MLHTDKKTPLGFRAGTLLGAMIVLQALWLGAKIALVQTGVLIANPEANPFAVQVPVLTFMVVGTLLIVAWPTSAYRRLPAFEKAFSRHPWYGAALLGSVAIAVALLPVFTFPIAGDEKRLYDAGALLAERGWGHFFSQYSQTSGVGDRHPFLVPLLAGVGQALFGDHPSLVRILFLGFVAGSTVLTYAIGKRIYDGSVGLRAAILFLALRYVLFMGVRVNTDVPVTFFALLAVYLTLRLREAPTIGRSLQLGGALGLGLLSKYTMGLIVPVLGYVLLQSRRRSVWAYAAGALTPLAVLLAGWAALLYASGALGEQIQTVGAHAGMFGDGGDLLSSWRMQLRLRAMVIQVPSALGAYVLPIIALGGWTLARTWTDDEQLLAVWIGTVVVLLMVMLPDERYFLPAFPAVAIAGAVGLQSMGEKAWRLLLLALIYSVGTILFYT